MRLLPRAACTTLNLSPPHASAPLPTSCSLARWSLRSQVFQAVLKHERATRRSERPDAPQRPDATRPDATRCDPTRLLNPTQLDSTRLDSTRLDADPTRSDSTRLDSDPFNPGVKQPGDRTFQFSWVLCTYAPRA